MDNEHEGDCRKAGSAAPRFTVPMVDLTEDNSSKTQPEEKRKRHKDDSARTRSNSGVRRPPSKKSATENRVEQHVKVSIEKSDHLLPKKRTDVELPKEVCAGDIVDVSQVTLQYLRLEHRKCSDFATQDSFPRELQRPFLRQIDGLLAAATMLYAALHRKEGIDEDRKARGRTRSQKSNVNKKAAKNTEEKKRAVPARSKSRVIQKPTSYALIVRGQEGESAMSSEAVKAKVMQLSSDFPEVRVKSVKVLRNEGVVIETLSGPELKQIKECGKFTDAGLSVSSPKKLGYKMLIRDVCKDMSDDEFMDQLFNKNLKSVMTLEEFKEDTHIISRRRESIGSIVVEVSQKAKEVFSRQRRVYIGWGSHQVRQLSSVLACYKCSAYGHIALQCSVETMLCRKCGDEGHIASKCKSLKPSCRNCKLSGCKDEHMILSEDCPMHRRAMTRISERRNPAGQE